MGRPGEVGRIGEVMASSLFVSTLTPTISSSSSRSTSTSARSPPAPTLLSTRSSEPTPSWSLFISGAGGVPPPRQALSPVTGTTSSPLVASSVVRAPIVVHRGGLEEREKAGERASGREGTGGC
ncbi:hypothetical protein ABZP36_007865 [Zizania latifolia]